MPELPEAETIARDLRQRVVGAVVLRARLLRPDLLAPGLSPRGFLARLANRRIDSVERRAKKVILRFDDDSRLVISLGMTGRVVTSDAARAGELRHVGARLELADGRAILYDDARRFGELALVRSEEWDEWQTRLGLEPFSDDFTADALHALTRTSIVPIRNWLLDQRRVAGIGNIYALEALFLAGVRPTRRARTLTRRESTALRDALRLVLTESIDVRGTTISDYRDAAGERGGYDQRLRVYDREGLKCRQCGERIKRKVLTNRSAFYCPNCQR